MRCVFFGFLPVVLVGLLVDVSVVDVGVVDVTVVLVAVVESNTHKFHVKDNQFVSDARLSQWRENR